MYVFILIFTLQPIPAKAAPESGSALNISYEGSREKLNFNQGWKFIRRNIPDATGVDYPMSDLEGWENVNLPHTVREEPYQNSGRTNGGNYQGQAMYRKHFSLPDSYQGKKLYIEFEAIMGVSDVWVNGQHLQSPIAAKTGTNTFYGGYLPIILDVTDVVKCDGSRNVITVLADNSDNGLVPPGKPQKQLDYSYFGGIYRNAWLEVTNPIHITNANFEDVVAGGGVLVDYPKVSKSQATVSVKTHIRNEAKAPQDVTLKTEVVDSEGSVVAQGTDTKRITNGEADTFEQSIKVTKPKLWNLETPNMYKLVSHVTVGDKEIDKVETPIGIRKVEMSKETGILINGEHPGFLSGVNRHQEYPYIGFAASTSLQRRDAIKFKEAGFNIVRVAHHVPSSDFLDACDELGIFVMDCVPGWQYWDSNPVFGKRVKSDIQQMIRRDRNHPSIFTFEISLNESPGVPANFTNDCEALAKKEHPSLKTSAENPHKGAVADVLYGTPEEVASWSDTAMSLIREYGDHWEEQNGLVKDFCRVTRGPGTFYPGGEAAMVTQGNNKLWNGFTFIGTGACSLSQGIQNYNRSDKRFVGVVQWIGIDHNRGYHDTMSPCGIMDLRRIPKYSYYAFESQRPVERDAYLESKGAETGPSMFIASSWGANAPILDKKNTPVGTDTNRIIYVYSNTDKVRLSVIGADGTELWTQTHNPINDKTAGLLDHPPYLFENVPYTAGSYLKAEGLSGSGDVILTKEMHTAGVPAQLKIEVDQSGANLVADGSDAAMAYAYVLDADGNLCQEATNTLTFSLEGDAKIIGDGNRRVGSNPVDAEAGIMGVMIQAGMTAGPVKVKVEAAGLTSAEATITTEEFTQKYVPYEEVAAGPPLDTASMFLTEKEYTIPGFDVQDITKGTVTVNENPYNNSIEFTNMTRVNYALEGTYSRLTAKAALKDSSNTTGGAVFKIYLDGVLRYVSSPVRDNIVDIDIDLSGAQTMTLVGEDITGANTSNLLWLSPYIYEGNTLPDESELRENLALNKTAKASSSDTDTPPASAVDGNITTLWRSGKDVTKGKPQSWQLDLGEAKNIRNAKLAVEHDYLQCTYDIYTSKDGNKWDKKATGSKTAHGNDNLDKFTAEGVQYIKVEFTDVKLTQGGGEGREPRASIKEFEVYADKGVDTVNNYNLKGFSIGGKDIAFDAKTTDYTMPLEGYEKDFYVKALPVNSESTVKINGTEMPAHKETNLDNVDYTKVSLNKDGQIVFEVISPDGLGSKTYIVQTTGKNDYNLFPAVKCLVPGKNGANNWYYQTMDKNSGEITSMPDNAFGYIKSESAWGKGNGNWIYSGPRFLHSAENTLAVRTFEVPKDGTVMFQTDATKYTGQAGSVAFKVLKNGKKVWPADSEWKVLGSTGTLNISFSADVAKGDKLQLVMDPDGNNGGDATCALSTVQYMDSTEADHAEIQGKDILTKVEGTALTANYTAEIFTADGTAIPDFECEWSLQKPVAGVVISDKGVLSIDEDVKNTTLILQVSKGDKLLGTKSVTIKSVAALDYLSDLEWTSGTSGDGGSIGKDVSHSGAAIQLTGSGNAPVTYEKGLGVHAPSEITYNIKDRGYTSFEAMVGVDYSQNPDGFNASVTFKVYLNGDETNAVFDSGEMVFNTEQKAVNIPLDEGIETITLVVEQGENDWSDHSDWADAKFIQEVSASVDTVDTVAESLTVRPPAPGETQLEMPTVPTGFNVALTASSNEDVIALDGTITPPDEALSVALTFTVSDEGDSASKVITVVVPPRTVTVEMVADALTVTMPQPDETKLAMPAVPNGFSVAITASGNENVIALDGTITPPEQAMDVDVTFIVTKDGKSATKVITIAVPAKTATVEMVADALTVTPPEKDAVKLEMPVVPEGFSVALTASGNINVIALDGTIIPPSEVTSVELTFTVTKDGKSASKVITVTVPSRTMTVEEVADSLTVTMPGKNETKLTMPEVPEGFSIAIKSTSNENIIALDGTIVPQDKVADVDVTFIVTSVADETVSAEKTITVRVPAKTGNPPVDPDDKKDILINKGDGTTPPTEIQGIFSKDAVLNVAVIPVENDTYKALEAKMAEGMEALGAYEVSVTGEAQGSFILTFQVGEKHNGRDAIVYHMKEDGEIEAKETVVKDGKITITIDSLSPFMITVASAGEEPAKPSEPTKPSDPTKPLNPSKVPSGQNHTVKTGDDSPFIMLFIICLLAGGTTVLIIWKKKRL